MQIILNVVLLYFFEKKLNQTVKLIHCLHLFRTLGTCKCFIVNWWVTPIKMYLKSLLRKTITYSDILILFYHGY